MAHATVILGRDGMGDATEADFDAWVAFVTDRIDVATGLDIDVETRNPRDVQDDQVRDHDRYVERAETVRNALADLWEQFCADPAAWSVQ